MEIEHTVSLTALIQQSRELEMLNQVKIWIEENQEHYQELYGEDWLFHIYKDAWSKIV